VAVPSHGLRNLLAMHRRRPPNVSNHGITSESSCASPIDTDNDRPFEPDSSETDLTEPECSPPGRRKIARKKPSPSTGTQSLQADLSNVERVRQARYQVPDDDTDEDLAQVPEDYGRSNKTKKLKLRLKERLGLVLPNQSNGAVHQSKVGGCGGCTA
jgi:hypothetical protein